MTEPIWRIWAITQSSPYEDTFHVGFYSTKEKAEKALNNMRVWHQNRMELWSWQGADVEQQKLTALKRTMGEYEIQEEELDVDYTTDTVIPE